MNKRLLSLAVAGAMVLGLAGVAAAGIPDETTSTASSAGGVVLVTPAGTGDAISDVGGTVTVTVLDAGSAPVANYPFQDIYLDDPGNASIVLCQGGTVADADTDNAGVTTISGIMSGGGSNATTQVYINGTPLSGAALGLGFVSPDISADLLVDIIDFGLLGDDFGGTAFRSDFFPDGSVDITDFGIFGQAFGESCP